MLVEVWSDVVCPWCYIGKRRFAAARDRLAADRDFPSEVDVVYKPYQLDPKAPPGTAMPVLEVYARKFGGPERAASIIEHLTETAAADGLEFHLDRAQRANTRDAHRLLWYAAEQGPPQAQDAVKERLLSAYFTRGLNIGDTDVLVTEAEAAGLDRDAVRHLLDSDEGRVEVERDLAFAAEAGITAVPTYVIDRRWSIPGAQDPDVFVQVLQRLAQRRVPAERLAAHRHGHGRRLVLVHGFTQTSRSWAPLAEHLAERYEVVAVDAPGHGGSAAVEADLPTGGGLLGVAGGPATYVGYSMGGRLCLHLALDRPELVERLVLISATAGIDDVDERAARRRADEALAVALERDGLEAFLARWVAQPMFAGLHDPGLDDRSRNTVGGLASSLRLAGTGTQQPLWSRLASFDAPVLLVAGRLDAKFVSAAERMAGYFPHATVALVDGAGHTVHVERPDEFSAILDEWLAATEPQYRQDHQ